ncbi:DNA repair protein radc [groundwater metagenome]
MYSYRVRITDIPVGDRPRSRLLKYRAASLSTAELLSIILRTGSVQENALSLAHRLLAQYNLQQLSSINPTQLMGIHGIKTSKAAR